MCCDATYAKSKQGIFKLVMIILSFIAWLCVACTPYFKVRNLFIITLYNQWLIKILLVTFKQNNYYIDFLL